MLSTKGNPVSERPIINSFMDKVIPKGGKSHESHQPHESNGFESQNGSGIDILARLNISPKTELMPEVLTPGKAKKVRFHTSTPRGFSFPQVEEFYGDVITALEFYVAALERRDADVHRLATEIDKYIVDLQNAKYQLEVFEGAGGKPLTDANGNYLTEGELSPDQSRIIELERDLADTQTKLLLAQSQIKELQEFAVKPPLPTVVTPEPTFIEPGENYIPIEEFNAKMLAIEAWEKEVTEAYEELEGQVEGLRQRLVETTELNEELTEKNRILTEEINAIKSNAAEAAVPAMDNSEEIAALNERLRIAEELNAQYAGHIAALDDHINTLEETIRSGHVEESEGEYEAEPQSDYVPAPEAQTGAYGLDAAFDEDEYAKVYTTQSNFADDRWDDDEDNEDDVITPKQEEDKIINGINISKLPAGVTIEDLI